MPSLLRPFVAAGLLAAGSQSVQAGSATSSFQVSMTVQAFCQVTATNLDFGTVNALSTSAVDATNQLSITCSDGTPYSVSLDAGVNASGAQRRLSDGTRYLNYQIYRDAGRSTAWTTLSGQTGDGTAQTVTLYGRVPAGQSLLAPGTYTDTVTVSVSY